MCIVGEKAIIVAVVGEPRILQNLKEFYRILQNIMNLTESNGPPNLKNSEELHGIQINERSKVLQEIHSTDHYEVFL